MGLELVSYVAGRRLRLARSIRPSSSAAKDKMKICAPLRMGAMTSLSKNSSQSERASPANSQSEATALIYTLCLLLREEKRLQQEREEKRLQQERES